jgi:inosine-uridine nucleoside N-ribohydrolase
MVKLIIDTDLGCDYDDAVAVALANIAHKNGGAELLAITESLDDRAAGLVVAYICDYYKNIIDIGVASAAKPDCKKIFSKFVNSLNGLPGDENRFLWNSAELIRQKLLCSSDKSVVLLCIGTLNNLAELVGRDGARLLRDKTREIVVMGGNFTDYNRYFTYGNQKWEGEYNIVSDIKSAQTLVNCDGLPLSFLDFNQGLHVLFNIRDSGLADDHPLTRIFRRGGCAERPCWDVVSLLYALGKAEIFEASEYGRVNVDDRGKTTFIPGVGTHRLIKLIQSDQEVMRLIYETVNKYRTK